MAWALGYGRSFGVSGCFPVGSGGIASLRGQSHRNKVDSLVMDAISYFRYK